MNENEELTSIARQLTHEGVGSALEALENFAYRNPAIHLGSSLASLREDYDLMATYWRAGVRDPQRKDIYERLRQRLALLVVDAKVRYGNIHIPYRTFLCKKDTDGILDSNFTDMLRARLERHVTDLAMLELEQPHVAAQKKKELLERHTALLDDAFACIAVSSAWRDGVGETMTSLLLSPTIDANDQQLLVSAVTLACLNTFDPEKFSALFHVYREHTEQSVRQRALVGWALTLGGLRDFPETESRIKRLVEASAKDMADELCDLQMQLVYCLDADADNRTINEEIMPDLIDYGRRHGMPGNPPTDDDALSDIIDPEASEREMERVEQGFRRMAKMQQAGSDIYFSGFAQMKRFPFFQTLAHWFTPFSFDNPVLDSCMTGAAGRLSKRILSLFPFCNSDKFSFAFACQRAIDRLPESMREQIVSNTVLSADDPLVGKEEGAAYLRRVCLQDLYRFYRLFPSRECFVNPFEGDETSRPCFFVTSEVVKPVACASETHVVRLASFLLKRHYTASAAAVAEGFTGQRGYTLLMLCGALAAKGYAICGESRASSFYRAATLLDIEGSKARVAYARAAFREGDVETACREYGKLSLQYPDVYGYKLSRLVCLLHLDKSEEALPELFQCDYEHPDDADTKRTLARAMMEQGKADAAWKHYTMLLALSEDKGAKPDDKLNAALCAWLAGRPEEAAKLFAEWLRALYPQDTVAELRQRFEKELLTQEKRLLSRSHIEKVDCSLMSDEVAARCR